MSRLVVIGRSVALFAAVGATATVARTARADGGYFAGVQGARATGRGGAFTARADDLSAVMLNPAGLAHVEGNLLHIGNRFSYNSHEFTRVSTRDYGATPDSDGSYPRVRFAPVQSQQPQAVDPILGIASHLGLKDWTFALAIQAPAGAAMQSFSVDGGQRYMMVDVESLMLNYSLTAAWKPTEQFGIGASVQWIHVPSVKYSLVINGNLNKAAADPVSSDYDMLSTVTGSAPFALNTVVGAWFRPVPSLEIGVAGQVIPTQIKASSHIKISPTTDAPGEVELLRDGDAADDVTITLPLPLTARAGIRYRQLQPDKTELFDVELDAVYETWSRVDRLAVDTNRLKALYGTGGGEIGTVYIEKRWRDTIGIHLGGDYALIPSKLAARAGVFYNTPTADPAYSNVDFVTGAQMGGAIGASLFLGKHEIALAYEYRRQETVSLREKDGRVYQTAPLSTCKPPYTDTKSCNENVLGQPAPVVNAGVYEASSHVLAVDWLYRF